jgi:type I restriction enzyme S subunit
MRDGWIETTLGDICKDGLFADGDWVESKDQDPKGDFRLLQLADIGDGVFLDKSDRWMNKEQFQRLGCTKLEVNDVLIARMPEPIGRACLLPEGLPSSATVVDVAIVRTGNEILQRTLSLIINTSKFRNEAFSLLTGTTRQRISRGNLSKISFWLPSLPEQTRIVDLISSVDSYVEALQQQLESAKRSRNAVLQELLTAGGDDWVETTLGEVTQINPEQAKDFDSERLIKYVDLSTVTFDNGIDSEIDPIPFNEAPGRARRIVRENDVIVATVRPYLKGFAFVNKDFNEQIASTGFCVIRAESELILPELVWALVGSDDFVEFLIGRSTGSSYPAVRPIDISEFNFMLPPFKDQETVSQLIRTFDQLIKDSINLINSTQNFRSGLLADLLSGAHEIPSSYDKVMGAA